MHFTTARLLFNRTIICKIGCDFYMNNILIVDDVAENRMLIKIILLRNIKDAVIYEAEDGFVAMDELRKAEMNAIILDIMMPGKDGLKLLEEVKANSQFVNIPVIMWTAVNEYKSLEIALEMGALDYFTKPLSEEDIKITLPLKVKNALNYHHQKMDLIKYNEHIKYEMQIAKQLQKSLITEKEAFELAQMWGRFIPCDEIGGDLYCLKLSGNKLWFMIADVVGHGISAAMVSAMLKIIFNANVENSSSPRDIMNKINLSMIEVFDGSLHGFISCFIGCIEGNLLHYTNAGHPYPVYYKKATDEFLELKYSGLQLGMFENSVYEDQIEEMNKGDRIVLYTDGLFDKGKNHGFSYWEDVLDYCKKNQAEFGDNVEDLLDSMVEYFSKLGNMHFIDDVAIMVLVHN